MTKQVFGKITNLILGAVFLICGGEHALALNITNEVWLWTSSSSANLGTLAEPYNASGTNFDYRMSVIPSNTVIHLLPGTYWTKGTDGSTFGWFFKLGQRILGSGMDRTTVLLTNKSTNANMNVAVLAGAAKEISDLTVDCNYPSTAGNGNFTYHGVNLSGMPSCQSQECSW
jgi:hypothetical protein